MKLQYISDSTGKTTGVYIPISEWNELKAKYKGIDQEKIDIPDWQKEEMKKRLDDFKNNAEQALDFDSAMDSTEKDLQMYNSEILPMAKKDISEAASWYNSKEKGLGKRFIQEVRNKVLRIRQNPKISSIRYDAV